MKQALKTIPTLIFFTKKLNEQIYNTIDLENINEIHGIKRGMISQTKINAKSENECCFCCTVS